MLAYQRGHRLFVAAVDVGIDETHRDRINTERRAALRDGNDLGLVERYHQRSVGADALGDFKAQPSFHQRWGLAKRHIVQPWRAESGDLEDVTKTFRRDQGDAHAGAFDDGIGGDSGAVYDFKNTAGRDARLAEQRADTVLDCRAVVVRCGQYFLGVHGAVDTEQHDVGEGAADINTEAKPSHPLLSCSSCRRRSSRSAAVAAASMVSVSASTTTAYSARACATDIFSCCTSSMIAARSRSSGSP